MMAITSTFALFARIDTLPEIYVKVVHARSGSIYMANLVQPTPANLRSLTDPFTQALEDDDLQVLVTNHLWGHPLYSWWVIALDKYNPADIEGVLTDDIRPGLDGPYNTFEEALVVAKKWFVMD
jgi:hypothetical protein